MNAKTTNGSTVLIQVAENGNTEVVKVLLETGANVNAKDNEGRTALMRAKETGHKEIIQLLKKAGAN